MLAARNERLGSCWIGFARHMDGSPRKSIGCMSRIVVRKQVLQSNPMFCRGERHRRLLSRQETRVTALDCCSKIW
jgi:hypothetical protein